MELLSMLMRNSGGLGNIWLRTQGSIKPFRWNAPGQ